MRFRYGIKILSSLATCEVSETVSASRKPQALFSPRHAPPRRATRGHGGTRRRRQTEVLRLLWKLRWRETWEVEEHTEQAAAACSSRQISTQHGGCDKLRGRWGRSTDPSFLLCRFVVAALKEPLALLWASPARSRWKGPAACCLLTQDAFRAAVSQFGGKWSSRYRGFPVPPASSYLGPHESAAFVKARPPAWTYARPKPTV